MILNNIDSNWNVGVMIYLFVIEVFGGYFYLKRNI